MTFSSTKAQEIYELIRNRGKINYWIAIAEKNYMTENPQYNPGPKWNCDGPGLREDLKLQLATSVNDVGDKDWDEIATRFFDLAALAKK